MKPESVVFAIAGAFFGLMVGWIIGTQQGGPPRSAVPFQGQAAPAAQTAPVKRLDEARAQALSASARNDPGNAQVRVELGNLYFDAERFDEAIKWYSDALAVDPRNPDASTDLGVAYYYTNQADRALEQFEHSLSVDPKHTKTMLNMGIVRAFGKQDLDGAIAAWQKLIETAPDSPDGQAARKMLDGMKAGHEGVTGSAEAPASQPAAQKAK